VLLRGFVRKSTYSFNLGEPLYISSTSGAMTVSVPTGGGSYVRIVGYAVGVTNTVYFNPDNTWVVR
jgi:hypothetical protein